MASADVQNLKGRRWRRAAKPRFVFREPEGNCRDHSSFQMQKLTSVSNLFQKKNPKNDVEQFFLRTIFFDENYTVICVNLSAWVW